VRGGTEVRRHLKGDPAVVVELAGPGGKKLGMLRHPLQRRIADKDIDADSIKILRRSDREADPRTRGCAGDHLR